MTLIAQATKARTDKWDYIILNFGTTRETTNRVKGSLQNGRKDLQTISLTGC